MFCLSQVAMLWYTELKNSVDCYVFNLRIIITCYFYKLNSSLQLYVMQMNENKEQGV